MSYLRSLSTRRKKESATEILWEVERAFVEADPASPACALPRVRTLRDLVRFTQFDSIAESLRSERPALEAALAFARQIEADELASLLEDALAGKPQAAPVFAVELPGHGATVLDVNAGEATKFAGQDWSGTDIALSFVMEDFEEAVLDALIAAADEFDLVPPAHVTARGSADEAVNDAASDEAAAEMFRRLVSGGNPRIEAGSPEQCEARAFGQGVELPVRHVLNPPASASDLVNARDRFGPAAAELLSIYEIADGGQLFSREGECAFYFGAISEWDTLHSRAIEWAEGVTWQSEPEEIPAYLYSAIAFGMIPFDSERWLLITEGEHAGKILLSDTDVIEDEPRFESVREFMATLLHDAGRILGCGGHVRYVVDGDEVFPMRYLADYDNAT